ncbi:hypothetical protein LMG28688_02019 [Paraburkholderia caffeinitolerans]|uniref:EAL domain-containing protein n=1 Tax=Paraburkholderia caffeinitolerans TaxID=1723730 RepID=A0A6J5FQR3_9BURK|nr:EAL domain-containing protein [Paraburkholderia caffeinitolerans]CAB3785367.1 hypothetical protein LMG28688_02019 [Paraburkholderia caffeinitolerans]
MNLIPVPLRPAFDYLSQDLLRRVEIRYRLMAAFVLLCLLPVIISGCISYVKSVAAIKENAEVLSREVVEQVSKNVRMRMEQIETESKLLVVSSRLQGALAGATSTGHGSEAREDMARLLLEHFGSMDFINQKYLLDKNNRILDTQAFAQLTRGVSSLVGRAEAQPERTYWGSYDNGVGEQNLGMVTGIFDKSNDQKIGNLVLVVRPQYFSTIFSNVASRSGMEICILDADSKAVVIRADDAQAHGGKPWVSRLIGSIEHNGTAGDASRFLTVTGLQGERYLVAYARIPDTSWLVVSMIAETSLTAEVRAVRNQIVLVGISGFLLSLFLAYFISRSISEPLSKLLRKMHDTGDDAGVPFEDGAPAGTAARGQDELARLELRFERMRAAIGQKIQKINEINASLEQTIIERTAELVARERESRTLIENSPDTITRYDRDVRRIYANPAFCSSSGSSLVEALGKRPSELPGGPNALIYERKIREVIASGKSTQFELRWVGKEGSEQCSHIRITPEIDLFGEVNSVMAVGRDLSDRMAFEATIWRQANFDALTGLPNRQMFHERLDHEAQRSRRSGRRMALMLIDLDRFKEVNDSLGHDTGDVLLVEAARRINACVREMDTVARLGGDEFTIILPELEDDERVERLARAINASLALPFKLGADEEFISASIGITFYPDDADELDVLFKNADQAMYASKNAGRNRFCYFTPAMRVVAERRLRLTSDLRAALPEGQFQLFYQPIIELATGTVCKAEALIRWFHPVRGMISPLEFIPLAEDTGLIVPIGDWVFRQAMRQARRWRERYHGAFQVSVNMSPVQVRQDSMQCARWSEYLEQEGMAGGSVAVEITEGVLLQPESNIDEKLLTLRRAGIGISIDDFGTGYSSLAYLQRFEIDYLKIDRSFVQNLSVNVDNQALCEGMVVLAHKLGIQVIAEGVETAEQEAFLKAVGCDFAQGFLYSKPVSPDQFEAWAWRPVAELADED